MLALRPYLLLFGILGVLGTLGGVYIKGRMDCSNAVINKALQETIEKKEKLDEIRNNRPDTKRVIERLRAGSF